MAKKKPTTLEDMGGMPPTQAPPPKVKPKTNSSLFRKGPKKGKK